MRTVGEFTPRQRACSVARAEANRSGGYTARNAPPLKEPAAGWQHTLSGELEQISVAEARHTCLQGAWGSQVKWDPVRWNGKGHAVRKDDPRPGTIAAHARDCARTGGRMGNDRRAARARVRRYGRPTRRQRHDQKETKDENAYETTCSRNTHFRRSRLMLGASRLSTVSSAASTIWRPSIPNVTRCSRYLRSLPALIIAPSVHCSGPKRLQ